MTQGHREEPLTPGLYLVSTPIGNARDITLRALDILANADVLAAEDTRSLRKLMEIHGVPLRGRRVVAYHDHNGPRARPELLVALSEGKSVSYASEAGTPLVADPGFVLAREAAAAGHTVLSAPGASAALAALTVSGLPSDRFTFVGFPPNAAQARKRFFVDLQSNSGTIVFYESPKRLGATLAVAADTMGVRDAAVCRELTKRFEEVRRGTLADLAAQYEGAPPKGEVVVCIGPGSDEVSEAQIETALKNALKTQSVSAAAAEVSKSLNVPKRGVYQMALALSEKD